MSIQHHSDRSNDCNDLIFPMDLTRDGVQIFAIIIQQLIKRVIKFLYISLKAFISACCNRIVMINPAKANPEKSEEMAPKLSPKTPAFETEYSLIGQDKYSKVPAKSKYIDSIPPKTKNAILPTYKYPNLNALILRPARIFLERARHTTRFTRCGRDHYVGSRPRPRAQRLPPRAAREVHFCARRQVPSADLVTQVGFAT